VTPDDLRKIGKEIYGEHWQTPMAAALHVDARSIRRWLSGQHRINERTAQAVLALTKTKSE
jgi:hypothetical protein